MTSPLYIQQGPSPTWWNSPAIWLTAQGDPSTGPKVISPIVGKPYTVWVEILELLYGGRHWRLEFVRVLGNSFHRNAAIGQYRANPQWRHDLSRPARAADHRHHPWRDFDVARDRYSPSGDNLDADPQNGGHECLVAAVYDEQDIGGLPTSILLDGDATWNQSYSVAQHNLSVIAISMMMGNIVKYPFQVWNAADDDREFTVEAWQGRSARSPISSQACTAGGRSWRTRARSIASAFWRPTKLN